MHSNNSMCHPATFLHIAYSLSPLHLLLCCMILLLNSFTIHYYFKQRARNVPLLFIAINTSDIFTALGHISLNAAVICMCNLEADNDEDKTAQSVIVLKYGFLVYLIMGLPGYTFSIFYNLVLNLLRTVNIFKPFYRVEYKHICIVIAVHAAVISVLEVVDVSGYLKSLDPSQDYLALITTAIIDTLIEIPHMGSFLNYLSAENVTGYKVFEITSIVSSLINYQIPVLIVFLCMVVQVWTLRYRNSTYDDELKHVSITIIAISVLFCVCNSMMSIFLIMYVETNDFSYKLIRRYDMLTTLVTLSSNTLPLLNALLTPVILISRSRNLRAHLCETVLNLVDKVKTLVQVSP